MSKPECGGWSHVACQFQKNKPHFCDTCDLSIIKEILSGARNHSLSKRWVDISARNVIRLILHQSYEFAHMHSKLLKQHLPQYVTSEVGIVGGCRQTKNLLLLHNPNCWVGKIVQQESKNRMTAIISRGGYERDEQLKYGYVDMTRISGSIGHVVCTSRWK